MRASWFHLSAMSPPKLARAPIPKATTRLNQIMVEFGRHVFDERTRRRWRLEDLAIAAGMSISEVHRIESGTPVSLEACVRVGVALGMETDLILTQRRSALVRDADPVHAALGEIEAKHLSSLRHMVRLDEPYQHYQFAGRADLIAINSDARALLHIENRTRFPDVQSFAGSWNAKRAYLPDELARRFAIGGWRSIDHVVVALWSSEVLHTLRLRSSTFQSLCPDDAEGFAAWWTGATPQPGVRTSLVVFDPLPGQRQSRRRWVGMDAVPSVEPRYRGYADALAALRLAKLV